MEASTLRAARPMDTGTSVPTFGQAASAGFVGPLKGVLQSAGEIGRFAVQSIMIAPRSFRYSAEILRQIGIIVAGSAALIWAMTFIVGTMCATEAVYTLRGYGATAYAGSFTAMCGTREMSPYMFNYILAAKVGAGWVAEIGLMRTSDEIDALETSGIDPMRYLIGVRLMAAWMALPFLIITGLAFTNLGHFAIIVLQLGDVSQGAWELVHWTLQNPLDILFVLIKCMFMSTVVLIVALYYGYTARGGPVGVGKATANSMMFNMIAVNITSTMATMVFWGLDSRFPIGG